MKRGFGIILSVAVLIATCQLVLHDWRYGSADATVHVAPNRANARASGLSKPDPLAQRRILRDYGKVPLAFEKNQGQTDSRVKFLSRGAAYMLFLTANEAVLSLSASNVNGRGPEANQENERRHMLVGSQSTGNESEQHAKNPTLRMKLVGAKTHATVKGVDELPGKSDYFVGNDPKKWRTNVPTYAKVKYDGIYPGIDLVYYGNEQKLEYDFIVAPGAHANLIRLRFAEAENLRIDKEGALVLETRSGEARFEAPKLYQEVKGSRRTVEGHYSLQKERTLEFAVGNYDRTKPLFIDPVLIYATYLGGGGDDVGNGIAVDSSGNAYITGSTASTNFPTENAFQPTNGGSGDAFVTKISADGSQLVYSTYLGGSLKDSGNGIAVDSSGDAYVTGEATSADFPTTPNALQPTQSGSQAFVAEISADGSQLLYSTYLGGTNFNGDLGESIAVDSSGDAYVVGGWGTLNAFVAKISADGSQLVYSTVLNAGGAGDVEVVGQAIAVDSAGNAYATGFTTSPNFPTTPNAFQTSYDDLGNELAFVTKVSADGSQLVYSSYLGGNGPANGTGIAVDSTGDAYVIGSAGSVSGLLAKISPDGSQLLSFNTYSSNGGDFGFTPGGIALDSAGDVYITGAGGQTLPALNNQPMTCPGAFVARFNANELPNVATSTCIGTTSGGVNLSQGTAIAVDSAGNAYVTGKTQGAAIATVNALQPSPAGGLDAFVAKVGTVNFLPSTLTFAGQVIGTTSPAQTVTLTNFGTGGLAISGLSISGANASDFAETDNCVGSVSATSSCSISVSFTPTGAGSRTGTLNITDSAAGSPQTVSLSGTGGAPTAALSPTNLSFTGQLITTNSPTQNITLTNTGNVALTITSIAVTGTNSGEFSQSNTCGTSVAASANCTITVTFNPTATGAASASLVINDNASNSPQSVALTGTGTDFSLAAATSSNCPTGGNCSTTASVTAGQSATYDLQIAPINGFNATVTLGCDDALAESTCSVSPSSVSVNGTASAFAVTVTTTAASLLGPQTNAPSVRPPAQIVLLSLVIVILALFLVSSSTESKRWKGLFVPSLALLLLGFVLLGGCGGSGGNNGGSGGNPGTPSGTVTVTGTSNGVSHSVSLTLTVN
ncbi:MAG: SBBP repeat-containing protein [Candidatus Acidiferrales bacterium]